MSNYSDINASNPAKTPVVTDVSSVMQSISTIISVKKTELLFLPDFGGLAEEYLFEQINEDSAFYLMQNIINNINTWDDRVTLNLSKSTVKPDYDNNRYEATIVFEIKGVEGEFKLTKILNSIG